MKRFEIVLFGVLCIILSFSFSHASDSEIHSEEVKKGKGVKIAWDETTELENGKDISLVFPKEDYELRYVLYVTANKDEFDELSKDDPSKERSNSENNATIIFVNTGQYYIGVRAAIYKKNILKGGPAKKSFISWSLEPFSTNNNPFCVEVEN